MNQPYGTPQQRKEIYQRAIKLIGIEHFVCYAIIGAGNLRQDYFEWSKDSDCPSDLKIENFVTPRFPEFASQKPTMPIKSISSGWWYINDKTSRIAALNAAIALCDEQINAANTNTCTDCNSKWKGNDRCPECFPLG